jgi:hypothetical protein
MNISSIGNSGSSVSRPSDRPGGQNVMQQLRALAQSDPAKLKTVASDMASTLRADAQKAGGAAGQALSKIADNLDKVAQTGDLSALAPQNGAQGASGAQGHKHHHGHHHGGGGGAAKGGGDTTNPNDPFSEVRSDLLQAFTAALDAANNPVPPAPMPPTPTST